jgi:hypothetical protein
MAMTKRVCVFVSVLGLAVVISILFFGNYVFISAWSYDAVASDNSFGKAKVMVRVDTKLRPCFGRKLGILATSTRPYDLQLGFYTDEVSTLSKAVVEKLTLQFEDGRTVELVRPEHPRVLPFTPRISSNYTMDGLVYNKSASSGAKFTNCLNENKAFTVECLGQVVDISGTQVPLDVRLNLKPKKIRGVVRKMYLDEPHSTASKFPVP